MNFGDVRTSFVLPAFQRLTSQLVFTKFGSSFLTDRYGTGRRHPESRMATRALGDRADLGITDNLTLGAAPPQAATVRPLDLLLSDFSNLGSRLGR